MVDYAYTTVTGKISALLAKIRSVGVPPKISGPWLKTIGFTSSNDVTLVGVLKFIEFTDVSGIPNGTWGAYRGGEHKAVLGDAIRKGYAELYALPRRTHANSTRADARIQHELIGRCAGHKQNRPDVQSVV